jgi:outer membrane protein
MQKIISELIQAKQIKILLQKSENILFSDIALDLTNDVTSMMDTAASEDNTQSE